MFHVPPKNRSRGFQLAIIGLLTLSAVAFLGSVWVMVDFLREQAIVEEMREKLPESEQESATLLAGELQWQFRLSLLALSNLVATVIAVVLLYRAYQSSQDSLRDVKVLAADILGSMEQGVVTTDLAGILTSINRRGQELLNTSLKAVGRPLSQVSGQVPLDQFRQRWQASQDSLITEDFSIQENGSHRVVRISCQPLGDYTGTQNGQVLQLRDVTERVLIEERMRRIERYMALGSLAAGLHHEIKNPLAALSLHIQLIEEQFPDGDSAEIAEMLRVVRTEIGRIGSVLEGFRDFASIARLNLASVDPVSLANHQIDLLAPKARSQGVTLELTHDDRIPVIQADRVRLEQVLLNLMVNALEAMAGHSSVGSIQLHVGRRGDLVTLSVTDSGPGIPHDLHDKVFDPYFTTKGEGTGLGLALCDKIVRQHHGTLDFQSSDEGTRFQITIPIDHAADE